MAVPAMLVHAPLARLHRVPALKLPASKGPRDGARRGALRPPRMQLNSPKNNRNSPSRGYSAVPRAVTSEVSKGLTAQPEQPAAAQSMPKVQGGVRKKSAQQRSSSPARPSAADNGGNHGFSFETMPGGTVDEMAILMNKFREVDEDDDGKIATKELREIFAGAGTYLTDEDVQRVVEKFDIFHTGFLCQQDFRKLAKDLLLVNGMRWHFEHAFKLADKYSTGSIAPEDLREFLQQVDNRVVSDDELAELMAKYDIDQSGSIEKSEFLHMVRTAFVDIHAVMDYIKLKPLQRDADELEAARGVGEREGEGPSVAVTPGEVLNIGSTQQADSILMHHEETLVVLQCTFTWCRPCIGFKPKYKKLAALYQKVIFLQVTANEDEFTKELYERLETFTDGRISGTPAHILIKNRKLLGVVCGSNVQKLKGCMEKHMAPEDIPAAFVTNSL